MSVVERAAAILEARAHGPVRRGAPIGPLTSYRIGGPAGVSLEAEGPDDLAALAAAVAETGAPVLVVGRGSNMLVSDRGFEGIVVRLGSGFRWTKVEPPVVEAGAAMPLPALATLAADHALSGLEFGIAVPGSLGGAVRMNAGAHGGEMKDIVETVEVFVIGRGEHLSVAGADAGFAYRVSTLPLDGIVTAARLRLRAADAEAVDRTLREVREWRRENQPLRLPNGGSVFKNPPGDSAGRLVETVVGKGERVGGARVSEVHANFIVVDPGARADDVYTLMRRVQRRVLEATGVALEPELKLIGEFEEVEDGSHAG